MGLRSVWAGFKDWRRGRNGPGRSNERSHFSPTAVAKPDSAASSGGTSQSAGTGQPDKPGNGTIDNSLIHLMIAERSRKLPAQLRDQYEINMLSGIQDQRGFLHRVDKRNAAGINAIANGKRPGMPEATTPTTAANTSTAIEDDLAIFNRCNYTTHVYNQEAQREEIREDIDKRPLPAPRPQRQSASIPAWLLPAILLLIALCLIAGAIWWALTHQTPVKQPTDPGENAYTTIKLGDAP